MVGVPGDFSRLCALMREGRADQIEELYRDRIKAIKTFRQQNYDIQKDVISQVLMPEEFQNNFSAVKTKGDGCSSNGNRRYFMSLVLGKTDFRKGKTTAQTSLRRLCFYIDSTISLPSKSEISSLLLIFSGCTARFVSDLVGHPEDRFSQNDAHIIT